MVAVPVEIMSTPPMPGVAAAESEIAVKMIATTPPMPRIATAEPVTILVYIRFLHHFFHFFVS
ncbi:hypothetical protein [Laceyella putida]|uniref:Uncharacterized protein n=1 Tax=Laceyella putida TaxID=110101 RepID=A0ABW2RFM7_9BACL